MATTAQPAAQTAQPLSWFTRVAYGLGDTSCNVVWGAWHFNVLLYGLCGRFTGNRRLSHALIALFREYFCKFYL